MSLSFKAKKLLDDDVDLPFLVKECIAKHAKKLRAGNDNYENSINKLSIVKKLKNILKLDTIRPTNKGSKITNIIKNDKSEAKIHFRCQVCQSGFTKQASLLSHLKTHENKKKELKCQLCGIESADVQELIDHMTMYHGPQTKFVCNICGGRFLMEIIMLAHQESCNKDNGSDCDDDVSEDVNFDFDDDNDNDDDNDDDDDNDEDEDSDDTVDKSFENMDDIEDKMIDDGYEDNHNSGNATQKCHPKKLNSNFKVAEKTNLNFTFSNLYDSLKCDLKGVSVNNICKICNKTFTSAWNLFQHMRSHLDNNIICPICHKAFKTPKGYFQHMNGHREEKRVRANVKGEGYDKFDSNLSKRFCNLCNKSFNSHWNYFQHIKAHNNKHKIIKSFDDRKIDESECAYNDENDTSNNEDTFNSCSHCDLSFNNPWKCFQHRATHSESNIDLATNVCSTCNKVFTTLWNYFQHLKTHNKNLLVVNDDKSSPKQTNDQQTNNRKYKSPIDEGTICSFCNITFDTTLDYFQHMKMHGLKFRCKRCGNKYDSKYTTIQHVMSHLNIAPFKCLVCDRTFNSKSHAISHCKTHLRVQRYKCPYCAMGFSFISDKLKHEEKNNCIGTEYDTIRSMWAFENYDEEMVFDEIEKVYDIRNSLDSELDNNGSFDRDDDETTNHNGENIGDENNDEADLSDNEYKGDDDDDEASNESHHNGTLQTVSSDASLKNKTDSEPTMDINKIVTPISLYFSKNNTFSKVKSFVSGVMPLKDLTSDPSSFPSTTITKTMPPPSPPKHFQCSLCDESFSKKPKLDFHLSRQHAVGCDPYKCPLCPFGAAFKHEMVSHIDTHLFKKFFKCKVCLRRYGSQKSFVGHIACRKCVVVKNFELAEDNMESFDGIVEDIRYDGFFPDDEWSPEMKMVDQLINQLADTNGDAENIDNALDSSEIAGKLRIEENYEVIKNRVDKVTKNNIVVASKNNITTGNVVPANNNNNNNNNNDDDDDGVTNGDDGTEEYGSGDDDDDDKCYSVTVSEDFDIESMFTKELSHKNNTELTSTETLTTSKNTAISATTSGSSSTTSQSTFTKATSTSIKSNTSLVHNGNHVPLIKCKSISKQKTMIKQACKTPVSLKLVTDLNKTERKLVNGFPVDIWKQLVLKGSRDEVMSGGFVKRCEECRKIISGRHNYEVHVESHNRTVYECEVCHKKYKQQGFLLNHMKLHDSSKPNICSVCSMSFPCSADLNEHMTIHTGDGEYPFACTFCDKVFKKKGYLKCHIRLHTGMKPYTCTFCNRQFRIYSSLSDHLKIHTGATPYQCSYCKKRFRQRANCKTHERRHKGLRAFSCENCNKGFIQNYELQTHRLKCVKNEYKYVCHLCNMRFTKEHPLKCHYRRHKCIVCEEQFVNMKEKIVHQLKCRKINKNISSDDTAGIKDIKNKIALLYEKFEMGPSDDDEEDIDDDKIDDEVDDYKISEDDEVDVDDAEMHNESEKLDDSYEARDDDDDDIEDDESVILVGTEDFDDI